MPQIVPQPTQRVLIISHNLIVLTPTQRILLIPQIALSLPKRVLPIPRIALPMTKRILPILWIALPLTKRVLPIPRIAFPLTRRVLPILQIVLLQPQAILTREALGPQQHVLNAVTREATWLSHQKSFRKWFRIYQRISEWTSWRLHRPGGGRRARQTRECRPCVWRPSVTSSSLRC